MRIILPLILSFIFNSASAASSYTISPTATQTIDEFGVCRRITNNSGSNSLYVPTSSSGEWSSFYSGPGSATANSCLSCTPPWGGSIVHGGNATAYSSTLPTGPCSNVSQTRTCYDGALSGSFGNNSCSDGCPAQTVNWTISSNNCSATSTALAHGGSSTVSDLDTGPMGTRDVSCSNGVLSNSGGSCAPCSGTAVGGYCWYYGGSGQNCTTVCSARGGYNSATRTYAGDQGSNSNCQAVLTALGSPGSSTTDVGSCTASAVGCAYHSSYAGGTRIRCTNGATSTAGSDGNSSRACACNN